MTTNDEPRLQTGYDDLAASLTSGPDANQYRALLRAYLDHYDLGFTVDDPTADRIELRGKKYGNRQHNILPSVSHLLHIVNFFQMILAAYSIFSIILFYIFNLFHNNF